jgi:Zn-dependent peptidase ImmA (M78 family)
LRRFDLRQLANLKGYWKVSMAAIAARADRLKVITPYQSKMFWIEMSKLGYRKREPNEPPKEHPKLLRQMIAFHVKKLGYSLGEMTRLLHLRVSEFQQMYRSEVLGEPETRPQLRVVK